MIKRQGKVGYNWPLSFTGGWTVLSTFEVRGYWNKKKEKEPIKTVVRGNYMRKERREKKSWILEEGVTMSNPQASSTMLFLAKK